MTQSVSNRFPTTSIIRNMEIYDVKQLATWIHNVIKNRSGRLRTVSANVFVDLLCKVANRTI